MTQSNIIKGQTLSVHVKSRSNGSVKLTDICEASGISRRTIQTWFIDGKTDRIDLLIDGMIKREIGKYFKS